MLIFQKAESWKKYAVWNIAASAFMGFVFSPLWVILGLGKLIHWSYFSAFLAFTLIGFMAKVVMSLIKYIEEKYIKKAGNQK